MKRWLVGTFIFFLTAAIILAQDSAYKALKTVGSQRGERALNQIVSMVGNAGHSEPVTWSVSLVDPSARTGLRELQVTSGIITADRAPIRGGSNSGEPIDLSKLNVDSDGAFRAAEREAALNHVAFDSVNYQLSSRRASGTPTWRLELIDSSGNLVGTVRIAADTGAMISGENWVPQGGNRMAQERPDSTYSEPQAGSSPLPEKAPRYERPTSDYRDPAFQGPPPDNESDDHSGESVSSRANRYGASVVHFGETVADKTVRAARKVGGWFQKKITGQDTLSEEHNDGRDDQSEPPPEPDPYSQPVKPTQPN
jgi:hypothetical protein